MANAILLEKSLNGYFSMIVVDFTKVFGFSFTEGGRLQCYY